MKKLLLVTIALTAFVLFSCNQAASSDDTKKTSGGTEKPAGSSTNEVDLRNKDKSGTSVKRSAAADADDDAPIGVYVKKDPTCKFGPLTDEDLEKLISFEDDEKGFKINYTTPEALKDYVLLTRIIYIDKNGNWSTRQNIDRYAINEIVNSKAHVKDSYSWVYPLVLPGNTYSFAIQFQYYTPTVYSKDAFGLVSAGPDFQLFYSVTPKHGIGIIDDLPEDYNSPDFTVFEDGVFSLKNVIPVESESSVIKSIGLYGTNLSDKYWTDFQWIDGYDEEITDEPDSAITIDMTKRGKVTAYPYVYCQFMYKYYLKDYDDCDFQTPEFCSEIIENTFFVNK